MPLLRRIENDLGRKVFLFPPITLPMALAQDCSVSGPSAPNGCTRSLLRYSSSVKGNLQEQVKGVTEGQVPSSQAHLGQDL